MLSMIATLYYLLSVFMFLFTFWLLVRKSGHLKFAFLIGTFGWLSYVWLLSESGFLQDSSLPPRVPLLVVLPIVVVLIFFSRTASIKKALEKVNLYVLISIQSYRVFVELLIYQTYLIGIFPKTVTYEGINFDVIVGISAPVVGYLSYRNRLSLQSVLRWNYISLAVLGLTIYSFVSSFYFLAPGSGRMLEIATFPYILLPSTLLPFAIFYHVLCVQKCFQGQ